MFGRILARGVIQSSQMHVPKAGHQTEGRLTTKAWVFTARPIMHCLSTRPACFGGAYVQ
ncbi:MAG: hypothetical protein IPG44_12770 [Anaerolineales bacterium]|nr:hypothetical protein [Chloroflexota bacterium]MBK6646592.1 hypothetical protein [Anaerolineales bacterium]MCC6984819.1 hypothetical protein [Anaerolineales bacterium]